MGKDPLARHRLGRKYLCFLVRESSIRHLLVFPAVHGIIWGSLLVIRISFPCWCSAGNDGMTPINHPLWFHLRESPRFIPSFPAEHQPAWWFGQNHPLPAFARSHSSSPNPHGASVNLRPPEEPFVPGSGAWRRPKPTSIACAFCRS